MKRGIYWSLGLILFILWSFTSKVGNELSNIQEPSIEDIVKSYKKAVTEWPKPNIDHGVKWQEFAAIKTDSAYFTEQDKPNVILGKMLFLILNYQDPTKFPAVLVTTPKWDGKTEDVLPLETTTF